MQRAAITQHCSHFFLLSIHINVYFSIMRISLWRWYISRRRRREVLFFTVYKPSNLLFLLSFCSPPFSSRSFFLSSLFLFFPPRMHEDDFLPLLEKLLAKRPRPDGSISRKLESSRRINRSLGPNALRARLALSRYFDCQMTSTSFSSGEECCTSTVVDVPEAI